MSGNAFSLFLVFVGVAVAAGILAAWVVGPRRPWAPVIPVLAAFGALYLVGHRLGFGIGPTVVLFGFDVALLSDVVVALAAALIAAWIQRSIAQRRLAGAA